MNSRNNISTMEKSISRTRQEYAKYLKGKRVVVVGPAPSIIGTAQHDLIESYDVVVRLNRALPLPEHLKVDIGDRCDVLYNCMHPSDECGGTIDVDFLKKKGVKYLVSPYAPIRDPKYRIRRDIKEYWKKNGNKIPFCHFDDKYFVKLLAEMKLPNTGIGAILDLLQHDIQELYITGITFFKGGYMKEYRKYNEEEVLARMDKYQMHDQEKQMQYMKNTIKADARVKMDKPLYDIIYDETT